MGCAGVPLVETVAVQDDFVSGVDHIETVAGNCARLVWYVEEIPDNGSNGQRTTIRKLAIPHHCLPKIARKLLRYMRFHGLELGETEKRRTMSS